MIIKKIVVGELEANCYLAGSGDELFVIDPGADTDKIYSEIYKNGYKVKNILLTHCHYDHMGAAKALKERTGAKIGILDVEAEGYLSPAVNLSSHFGVFVPQPLPDFTFSDGDVLKSGKYEFKVIHTPGHTRGSVCFLSGLSLFSGDTLFYRSYGRFDLPTGNFADIVLSVDKTLLSLDDDIDVYPGHGRETKIGFEKKYNDLSGKSGLINDKQ